MKKALIVSILCLFIQHLFGQGATNASMNNYKLDFAIPDLPAYKILGKESSNLLRPSNMEELTAVVSQFADGSTFIIPGSFGAEISPNLLVNRNLTFQQYISNSQKFLRTLRISLASSRGGEANKVSNLALGIRFSPINDGDYKVDKTFHLEVEKVLSGYVNMRQKLAGEFLEVFNVTPNQLANDPSLVDQQNKYIEDRIDDIASVSIKNIEERYEEEHWNARKLDMAFAFNGSSPDSLLTNLEFRNFAAWITYANGIGKWGQYLLGLNYRYDDFFENKNQISLNGRLYGGKNRIKGFLEAQYVAGGEMDQTSFLFNSGFELNVTGSFWTDLSFGIESINSEEGNGAGFKSDFNLKYRF